VRDVDHHPEAVHLSHDLFAKARQAAVLRVIGRGVGPQGGAAVGQCHVPHAQIVEFAECAERVLDRLSTLDADERRDLSLGMDADDVARRARRFERR